MPTIESHTLTPLAAVVLMSLAVGCGGGAPSSDRDASNNPTTPKVQPPATRSTPERREAAPAPRNPPPADDPVPPRPEQIFRRSDDRPDHDADRLSKLGIRRFASERLVLFTDIDPEVAKTLPPLVDAAYAQWVEYFGEMPPDRERTPFQITGYLMRDEQRFKDAGLVPRDLPRFFNGRHRGYEFWMYDQEEPYYRRHLLLHEATHCFTTCVVDRGLPIWYLEGVAELFATHSLADGPESVKLRVMPDDKTKFEGLGRIALIEEAIAADKPLSLREVAALKPDAYLEPDAYAWAWAATRFFDAAPRYRGRFREAGRRAVVGGEPFDRVFDELLGVDGSDWRFGWPLFVAGLSHGYDQERAGVSTLPAEEIRADRGWQSTGTTVEKGQNYVVRANGTFTVAKEPVPWTSEANGVSIRYVDGQPIGRLLGLVRTDAGPLEKVTLPNILPLGNESRFTAPATGVLYLRVNDAWGELADNEGTLEFTIEPAE